MGWGRQLKTRPKAVNTAAGNPLTVPQTQYIVRPDNGNETLTSGLKALLRVTNNWKSCILYFMKPGPAAPGGLPQGDTNSGA